ncbi:MAG: ABC transporter substrate-binding protein [Clostridia bacterium]|nr:ABC transporter substrate-binding protein [Clostridia bacterium]
MKKFLALILALIMVLSMASFASAEQGASIVVGLMGDPGNIGPFQGMGLGRIGILFTTYEMLMVKDGDEFVGCLMKELTQVDDLTYDVEIYDYIKDQDGNPLTANDIKFCFDTAKSIGNLPKLSAVDSVEVLSDYVARFHFTSLAAGDLESLLMECPIVTQAAYEASADQMATDPVTTSPYRVTSYQTGSTIVYEYTGNYWQNDESLSPSTSKHNVDKVTFKIIPDAVQMTNALKTKEIDISAFIDSAYIADFTAEGGYSVTAIPDNTSKYLIFNTHVFQDANLRKAIAYGIDVEDLILFAYDGVALHCKTIGNNKYPDYVDAWDDEEYYEYDADQATALFAEAGVSNATYRLIYAVSDQNTAMATAMQADLMDFGINLELIPYDSALFGNYKYAENDEWDLMLDEGGSSNLLTNVWKLSLDRRDQTYGKTVGYVVDDTLQSLLEAAMADNSPENMDAFHQYLKEQCYEYGLLAAVNNLAHTTVVKEAKTCFRGQILPGACEY